MFLLIITVDRLFYFIVCFLMLFLSSLKWPVMYRIKQDVILHCYLLHLVPQLLASLVKIKLNV